jgi:hypothetical protein
MQPQQEFSQQLCTLVSAHLTRRAAVGRSSTVTGLSLSFSQTSCESWDVRQEATRIELEAEWHRPDFQPQAEHQYLMEKFLIPKECLHYRAHTIIVILLAALGSTG